MTMNRIACASIRILSTALFLGAAWSSSGDGFSGGFREALGPRYDAIANLRIAPTPR